MTFLSRNLTNLLILDSQLIGLREKVSPHWNTFPYGVESAQPRSSAKINTILGKPDLAALPPSAAQVPNFENIAQTKHFRILTFRIFTPVQLLFFWSRMATSIRIFSLLILVFTLNGPWFSNIKPAHSMPCRSSGLASPGSLPSKPTHLPGPREPFCPVKHSSLRLTW